MSREFYVPACTPYAYPQCGSGSGEGVVVGEAGVMDCMPLRPGPFHYLINEQAKSLVALQELQNEVSALLDFRDLVIETFPNLRHKMAASAATSVSNSVISSNQNSHLPLPLSSPSSRRIGEWEPGKVRRRIVSATTNNNSNTNNNSSSTTTATSTTRSNNPSSTPGSRDNETITTSLPRSRSNSHSGCSKNSGTVQDSGFSTETSSKDSASTAIPRPASPKPILDEAEDELWNLLDVIHRKGIKLRDEVESLQGRLESVTSEELDVNRDVLEAVKKITGDDDDNDDDDDDNSRKESSREIEILKKEKEQLLDKVAELEAETISSRARAQELQLELAALSAIKNGLEDRLRVGFNNFNDILTPSAQKKPLTLVPTSPLSSPKSGVNIRSSKSAFTSVTSSKAHKNRFRTRTIEKNVLLNNNIGQSVNNHQDDEIIDPELAAQQRRIRLGALDSVLISPTRVVHAKRVDSKKIAAILRERSPLELQRHLITTTVHNQCLQERLDEVQKSTETLSERLDKAREENDDLRFQLEERNIELEGTRARVRVLEQRVQQRPPTEPDPDAVESEIETRCEPCCLEPGSSTESSRDHHHNHHQHQPNNQQQNVEVKPSPRRRPPSRIPLPGFNKSIAPRPQSDSRESLKNSLKSLTKPQMDSSRDSYTGGGGGKCSLSKAKDTSRESLNKSLPKNSERKESNSKESLTKSSLPGSNYVNHHQSNNSNVSNSSNNPGTPPRRPLAPARRSHSLARASVDTDNSSKAFTDPPTSWCSSSNNSSYLDSLNDGSTSLSGSTKIEFIIGSPTRRFWRKPNFPWQHNQYFDSIESSSIAAESLSLGEALAECDSLDAHI